MSFALPTEYAPLLGSQRRFTANTRISTSDSQNSGMQLTTVPTLHRIRSGQRSSNQAQKIPTPSASEKISMKATPPRISVFTARPPITSSTSVLYL